MEIDLYKFNEMEKWFRKLFYSGEGDFLVKPMSHRDYDALMEEHPDYLDLREFFKSKMSSDVQCFVAQNRALMPDWSQIALVKHDRYSYTLRHSHEYVEAAYVYSGECTQYIGDNSFKMQEGDFCILTPNTVHCISSAADDAIVFAIQMDKRLFNSSFLSLMQEHNILAEFFNGALYGEKASPYILFRTGNDETMKRIFKDMYSECLERKRYFHESLVLYMRQVMIHILRYYEFYSIVPNPVDNKAESFIVPILSYIGHNYNQVNLRQVAEFFGYSESYLSKVLKDYTGKSFSILVTQIQMDKAKDLLTNSCLTLSEISQEIGCFDYSHFNHKFKKQFGITPAAFRKQLKENFEK